MFDEDKITLTRDTFKALASDTRVSILKLLLKRRMTLSELSKRLSMSVSTIKQHLDSLVSADLIKQIDDGHKWKYYELTKSGKEVVQPSERRVMILLGISAVAAFFGLNGLVGKLFSSGQVLSAKNMATAPTGEGGALGMVMEDAAVRTFAEAAPALAEAPIFPYFELGLTIAALLVLGVAIGYLYSKK